MGWPHRTDTWAHGAKPAQRQYAAIARAIAEFTPVTMCANEADFANCLAVFEDDDNVTVIEMTTNDAWFRDTGATFVTDGAGNKRACDWHFNAYGGLIDGLYFPWDADDQIAAKMAQLTGCVRYRPDDMILEGGSITVDGEGTVIVTDQCLLSPGRTASAVLAEEADEDTIWPAYAKKFQPWSEELRAYIVRREQDGAPVACDDAGCLWREDATNAHTDRFRAYVRHEIVPRAKERNPQLLEVLGRTMNLIADEDDMLEDMVDGLMAGHVEALGDEYDAGCVLAPAFGAEPLPLRRRAVMRALQLMLGRDARVETASVEAVLAAFDEEAGGKPRSGYVANIQGDLAVSANKRGVRIEPMSAYRARRKRG